MLDQEYKDKYQYKLTNIFVSKIKLKNYKRQSKLKINCHMFTKFIIYTSIIN